MRSQVPLVQMKHRSSVINHEQKWHDVEIKPGHFLQGRTNAELASTTKDLRDEKARMDTLLVRQYNLIQCFSNPKATGNESPKNNSDSSAMGQLYWILSLILFNEHHHLWVWNNSVTQSDAPSGMQAESRPCAVSLTQTMSKTLRRQNRSKPSRYIWNIPLYI